MKDLFQNPVYNFLSLVVDLVGVNLLFLLCCVPVITIGPALVALYTISLRLVRNTCDTPVRSFLTIFRKNLRQGIVLTLLVAVIGGFLLFITLWAYQISSIQEGFVYTLFFVFCAIVLGLFLAALMYLFALQAQFSNTLINTVLNAFRLAVKHLHKTLCLMIIPAGILWISSLTAETFAVVTMVLLAFGFVLIAYLQAQILVPIFDIYIKQAKEQ